MKYKSLLFITVFLYVGCTSRENPPAPPDGNDQIPIIQKLTRSSKLYTAEYKIHKIITHDDEIRFRGTLLTQDYDFVLPTGERKLAFPIDVTLKAYVDLSRLNEQSIEQQDGKIILTLPDPQIQVTSVKIDNKGKKQMIDLTRRRYTDEEIQTLARQGVTSILRLIPEMGIMETARTNAVRTLTPILTALGYPQEHIFIQFQNPVTIENIPLFLDAQSRKYFGIR